MPTTGNEHEIEYDAETAERAWRETQALRAALGKVPTPRGIDLQDVAILGLCIAAILRETAVRERFELLHPDLFDQALLDRIAIASWALWYAYNARLTAGVTTDDAQLSEPTLSDATALKDRMMRVLDYFLTDHRDTAELRSVRGGSGHKDLASDLFRLAKLYAKNREGLEGGGGKFYQVDDERSAKRLAGEILTELGASDATEEAARNDLACAFEVLEDTYAPVQRFAHALFPSRTQQFPSLWTVRSSGSAKNKAEDATGDGDDGQGA